MHIAENAREMAQINVEGAVPGGGAADMDSRVLPQLERDPDVRAQDLDQLGVPEMT